MKIFNKHPFPKIFVIILVIISISVIFVTSCKKEPTAPSVSFGAGKYRGTYTLAENWMQPSENKRIDTMLFDFKSNGRFYMRQDSNITQVEDFCEVNGNFTFDDQIDSLYIEITYIFPTVICNHDYIPQTTYFYYVSKDLIIFEDRSEPYRRLELWTE